MKKKIRYQANGKTVEQVITYIPIRYIVAILITVLEILAIIGTVALLFYYVPLFRVAAWVTEIAVVIRIIASDDNPDYKIPWLLFVLILPIAGFMLYFLFYSRKLQPKYIRRLRELKSQGYVAEDRSHFSDLKEESLVAYNQASMLCRIAESHLFRDTKLTYFPLGRPMFESLLADLEKAERFIFMDYFIIEEGLFWNSVLAVLKRKAAEGVEVRVLYDDIGCMTTLPGNYARRLRSLGIRAVPFSRLRGNADSEFNNRNHRKITVIDGRIGYTGGINLADEYIGEVIRFGHWKDIGMRLEGTAVAELTKLFLVDFGMQMKRSPTPEGDYFPVHALPEERGYLIPFGDGPRPIYERRVGKSVIMAMLASATRYVRITTPYLIIDNEMCRALEDTALRGVEVTLILPHIPDKKLVFAMSRSFYPRLVDAGVQIYEYEPGFLHAKSYLADGDYAMVGTINLDYRSLAHHFEDGVWMYRCPMIEELSRDFDATLEKSIRITPDMLKTSLLERFLRAAVRVFAPLL